MEWDGTSQSPKGNQIVDKAPESLVFRVDR